MDISMPVMDGIQATAKIKEIDESACVLVLTGSDSPRDVDAARRAGATGYVTKDRIAAELVQAIVDAAAC
jgi:DNA-binding NarL/FixJ family response regulator